MLEYLGISEQDFIVAVSAVGAFVGGIILSIRGAKKGRPTTAAAAAAVEAAARSCRARDDLGPALASIAESLNGIEQAQRHNYELLVRLEDRTRRD